MAATERAHMPITVLLKDPAEFRRLVEKAGTNQSRLAEQVGLQKTRMSQLVSGNRPAMLLDTAIRIADTIGVPVNEIFEFEGADELRTHGLV